MTVAQFSHHWRTRHRELALRLIGPGLMHGYVQNHLLLPVRTVASLPLAGDGFPELWVEGENLLDRLGTSVEYLEGAYLDEPNFMEGRSRGLLAREFVIDDGPGLIGGASLLKVMVFLRKANVVSGTVFADELQHDPRSVMMPKGRPTRLTRHVALSIANAADPRPFDAVEASYWPTMAEFSAAWEQRAAAHPYIDGTSLEAAIVQEEPVLMPVGGGRCD